MFERFSRELIFVTGMYERCQRGELELESRFGSTLYFNPRNFS
jgi:hypothetical protein